jgi:hypothetical protein
MGDKGQLEDYDIPNPSPHSIIPILKNPFKVTSIAKATFPDKNWGTNKLHYRITKNLVGSYSGRCRYILYVLYLGSEVQKSLETLRTTRVLDTSKLVDHVSFRQHAVFGSLGIGSDSTKLITDKHFMTWDQVLSDLLIMIEANLADFYSHIHLHGRLTSPELPNLVRNSSSEED